MRQRLNGPLYGMMGDLVIARCSTAKLSDKTARMRSSAADEATARRAEVREKNQHMQASIVIQRQIRSKRLQAEEERYRRASTVIQRRVRGNRPQAATTAAADASPLNGIQPADPDPTGPADLASRVDSSLLGSRSAVPPTRVGGGTQRLKEEETWSATPLLPSESEVAVSRERSTHSNHIAIT